LARAPADAAPPDPNASVLDVFRALTTTVIDDFVAAQSAGLALRRVSAEACSLSLRTNLGSVLGAPHRSNCQMLWIGA